MNDYPPMRGTLELTARDWYRIIAATIPWDTPVTPHPAPPPQRYRRGRPQPTTTMHLPAPREDRT